MILSIIIKLSMFCNLTRLGDHSQGHRRVRLEIYMKDSNSKRSKKEFVIVVCF